MRAWGLAAFALLALVATEVQALEVPPLRGRVNDLAGVLDTNEKATLEQRLSSYEAQTGHQYALLIVPSLEGDPIEDYTLRVVEKWRLGKDKKDDGVLLFIALAERKARIEVGYGLEGNVPDAVAAQVIRNVLAPAFKQGDFAGGISRAFDVLMQAGTDAGFDPNSIQAPSRRKGPDIPFFFILLILFLLFIGRGRGMSGFLLGSMLGGGWSSGGRRGGGGGFSGGGGRFGGGGASGGW